MSSASEVLLSELTPRVIRIPSGGYTTPADGARHAASRGDIRPGSHRRTAGGSATDDRAPADLRDALCTLLAGGEPDAPVRGEIAELWRRSAQAGLRSDEVGVPFDPHSGNRLLSQAAEAVLDQLAADLAAFRIGLVLADQTGRISERRVQDQRLRARLERVKLSPGFVFAEEIVGTNAVGTALAQRGPALVEGKEHFADALTCLAGAAAPISDPRRGNVIGAIGLVALTADASPLMVPLAMRAAREIEQRLLDVAGVSERLVLHRFLRERRRAKGPLVFVTQRTMITNTVAEGLVKTDDEALLRDCATGLRDGTLNHSAPIVLSSGTTVTVRGEPLLDGGSQIGTILRLTPVVEGAAAQERSNHGRSASGWGELTDTERRVVDLVVHGLTNREAAQRLFLSHHTVGFHLRSVFTKLGVNSRVELTRRAVQQAGFSDQSDAGRRVGAGRN